MSLCRKHHLFQVVVDGNQIYVTSIAYTRHSDYMNYVNAIAIPGATTVRCVCWYP